MDFHGTAVSFPGVVYFKHKKMEKNPGKLARIKKVGTWWT